MVRTGIVYDLLRCYHLHIPILFAIFKYTNNVTGAFVQFVDIGANLKILKLADLGFRKIQDIVVEPEVKPKKPKKTKKTTKPKVSKKPKTSTDPKTKRPRRKSKDDLEDIAFLNVNTYDEEDKPQIDYSKTQKDETDYNLNDEMALFAGLSGVDEVLYEEIEHQEDLDNLHPAEIAARYQATQKGPIGGSDEQILKDLRKLVFSVPLLHQEEVAKLFNQIDQCVFPTVYSILDSSMIYFEEIIQVIIKVAAGNTYGKNIYEKGGDQEAPRRTDLRGTYKPHEIKFLKNSYNLYRLFAHNFTKENNPNYKKNFSVTIERAMTESYFIRGVYEDILSDFVEYTKHYDKLHWLALEAKLRENHDEYHRLTDVIILLDEKLKLNKSGYYIARESRRIYYRYMELRAQIITPYLRSVYSTAKKTAKNSHQMLDNFQNGSIGLMRAVSCYSVKRLASFASVAKWWIKQMMLLAIKEDANFVKLPVSTWQAYTQLEKAKVVAGVGEENIQAIAKAAKMPLKKAKTVYHTVKIAQVYSLNRTYDSEEKLTLEDIMTNDDRLGGSVDPFTMMLREYCSDSKLSDKELKIMALRHGMVDLIPHREIDNKEGVLETLTQNLALLGYNYKFG